MAKTATLDRAPLEVINHLLTADHLTTPTLDPIDAPVWFRGPANWSMPNNGVMNRAVRDHGQDRATNYIMADVAAGRDPIDATESVFVELFAESYETACERAGGNELPTFQLMQITAGCATAATKRVWCTWAVERAIAENEGGEVAQDEDYFAAVTRETGDERVDVRFVDGREFQVKSVAGTKDSSNVKHLWQENLEDYFDGSTVRYSENKSDL